MGEKSAKNELKTYETKQLNNIQIENQTVVTVRILGTKIIAIFLTN